MSENPPNIKNDVNSIITQVRQETDSRIIEIATRLIDEAITSKTVRAAEDGDGDEGTSEINAGLNILFLKNKEYIESIPNESGGYTQLGNPSKVDGQGNYTMTIGCKIDDDDENSEYWEIDYSIVELP
jgi:hypothetical protein